VATDRDESEERHEQTPGTAADGPKRVDTGNERDRIDGASESGISGRLAVGDPSEERAKGEVEALEMKLSYLERHATQAGGVERPPLGESALLVKIADATMLGLPGVPLLGEGVVPEKPQFIPPLAELRELGS
jgi:hypothetical protein